MVTVSETREQSYTGLTEIILNSIACGIIRQEVCTMYTPIYPPELQLNKANISDTEAPFLDLHLSVANGFVSSKIYDKRDDSDFDFPFFGW